MMKATLFYSSMLISEPRTSTQLTMAILELMMWRNIVVERREENIAVVTRHLSVNNAIKLLLFINK